MLLMAPFLLVVGVVLPALAWSSYRWQRTSAVSPADLLSPRALAWQTVALQALVAALALLALWGGGIKVVWVSRLSAASILTTLGIVGLALAAAWWEARRPLAAGDELRRTLRRVSATDPVWLLATAAATISEELTYRGVLTQALSPLWGLVAGAMASALVFGLAHFGQGWRGVAFSAVYGLGMQALVVVSGGLSLAIIAHFSYDLSAAALGRRLAARERDPAAAHSCVCAGAVGEHRCDSQWPLVREFCLSNISAIPRKASRSRRWRRIVPLRR